MDVRSHEVLIEGSSTPNSPRIHHGRLWLLDSGNGHFGHVDREQRCFAPVAFCPAYARRMAFIGDFAVVGVSRARENMTFSGLALDARPRQKNTDTHCQPLVIDIKPGDVMHSHAHRGLRGGSSMRWSPFSPRRASSSRFRVQDRRDQAGDLDRLISTRHVHTDRETPSLRRRIGCPGRCPRTECVRTRRRCPSRRARRRGPAPT